MPRLRWWSSPQPAAAVFVRRRWRPVSPRRVGYGTPRRSGPRARGVPPARADWFGFWHALNAPKSSIQRDRKVFRGKRASKKSIDLFVKAINLSIWAESASSLAQRTRLQGCSISKRRQMDDGHRKEGNVHRFILAFVACLATLPVNQSVATAARPVKIAGLTEL